MVFFVAALALTGNAMVWNQVRPVLSTALACPNPRILVFSKTAAFRHDSIPEGIVALKAMGKRSGITVEATEDDRAFTTTNLSKFDCVVFLNTTGDVLNETQQTAFEKFVEGGGGYVGIHAAADCEYDWPWYAKCVGAYFQGHPAIQEATIKVEDRTNPGSAFLPIDWRHTDEWYNFKVNPRANVRVLASLDETSYTGGTMGDHPVMWCHEIGKGRSWYTNLGHRKETYQDAFFMSSLREGIVWASQGKRPLTSINPTWKPNQWTNQNGELSNGNGGGLDLIGTQALGDQLVHLEFKTPKLTNSGVFLHGRYEVQIFTSAGKPSRELTFADCGGISQRYVKNFAVDGRAPLRNAMREGGPWNTLDILFRAPRFDTTGKKFENARFVEVRLNGVIVQHNVEVVGPTRDSVSELEVKSGPLRLQGTHGPIEFRNVWVMPVDLTELKKTVDNA